MTDTRETGSDTTDETSMDLVQQAEQRAMAGQLALEMIHEIRGPLEALSYLTYLAAAEAADEAKVRKYMGVAEEQVARMSAISRQTLGTARVALEAGQVDLVQLAETALLVHRSRIERKRIHLKRRLPKELVVQAQHGPLLQVLSNLIANALDAMPEAGALSIRIRKQRGLVDVIVADNGHGIAGHHLERLGERYFTTKGRAGNGLGLAISKRIVEEHRGRMQVRSSVRPGRTGTVFKVSLPASDGGRAGTSKAS